MTCPDACDYDELTNADVMSGAELDEYERAAEYVLDAADDKRTEEETAAEQAEHEAVDG
jgi:hypothetical protein